MPILYFVAIGGILKTEQILNDDDFKRLKPIILKSKGKVSYMPIFMPTIMFRRAHDITPQYLKENNIKALLLDVDNTLTGHGSQELSQEISAWIEEMRSENIPMMIVSNNFAKRVAPFAGSLNMPFKAFSCKPSPHGLYAACKMLNVSKNEVALVGDQIFTDVIGANLLKMPVLLVQPMYEDNKITIRIKRWLEKPILAKYHKNGGKLIQREENK